MVWILNQHSKRSGSVSLDRWLSPHWTGGSAAKEYSYEIYLNTDYAKFNKSFAKKYDAYEAFLKERGIVKEVNTNSILKTCSSQVNKERLEYIQSVKRKEENSKHLVKINSKRIMWETYEKTRKTLIKVMEKI